MKIVSTVPLTPANQELIHSAAPNSELRQMPAHSDDDVKALAADGCDVMLTFRTPAALTSVPGLKWVQLLSAGADHALGPIGQSDLAITTASGIHATPIAEYTIASMLAWAHKLHVSIRQQMRHEWTREQFMATVEDLRGKTLGVIGYGSIGRETARLAQAFGMRVLALKRDPSNRRDSGWCPPGLGDPDGAIPERFYGPGECEAILGESDYITVTLPGTQHTRRLISAREIAAMRPSAYIVNIGRGEVIDQAALIEALRENRIGGAGLDVFEREPLEADSPLWAMENAILTPHMSGASRNYMDKACQLFADNLRRFVAGQPLLNLVDRSLGY